MRPMSSDAGVTTLPAMTHHPRYSFAIRIALAAAADALLVPVSYEAFAAVFHVHTRIYSFEILQVDVVVIHR